jgi:hypothetical protein
MIFSFLNEAGEILAQIRLFSNTTTICKGDEFIFKLSYYFDWPATIPNGVSRTLPGVSS